jgi:hypothetical protein
MILFSTMRKLQAKGARVYVVTVPACTMKKGAMSNLERDGFNNPAQDMEIPEYRDVFADPKAAARKAAEHDAFARPYGLPLSTLTDVPAASLDPLTLAAK